MSEEVWKDIKGFEGHYQVSNLIYRDKQNDSRENIRQPIKESLRHRGKDNTKNQTSHADDRECRHTLPNWLTLRVEERYAFRPHLQNVLTLNVIRNTGDDS